MTSFRKTVRDAVVARLIAGSTAAADRVIPSRVHSLFRASYPQIAVYTTSDTVTQIGQQPTEYERQVELVIQPITGTVDQDAEDAADALIDEVEALLLVDDNFGVTGVSRTEYQGAEIQLFTEGDRDYCSAVMRFLVTYYEVITPAGSDEAGVASVEFPEFDGDTIVTKP